MQCLVKVCIKYNKRVFYMFWSSFTRMITWEKCYCHCCETSFSSRLTGLLLFVRKVTRPYGHVKLCRAYVRNFHKIRMLYFKSLQREPFCNEICIKNACQNKSCYTWHWIFTKFPHFQAKFDIGQTNVSKTTINFWLLNRQLCSQLLKHITHTMPKQCAELKEKILMFSVGGYLSMLVLLKHLDEVFMRYLCITCMLIYSS